MDCLVPWPIQAREQLLVLEGVSTNVNKFHLCFVSKFLQADIHKPAKHTSITSFQVYRHKHLSVLENLTTVAKVPYFPVNARIINTKMFSKREKTTVRVIHKVRVMQLKSKKFQNT
jgi:hypothetical protein